jgi:protein SCO1/2
MKILLISLFLTAGQIASAQSSGATPAPSLYDLHERLIDQDGTSVGLDAYRGNPVLVTMFYGSCQATCPLIIDTLRAVERKLDPSRRAGLRVLLISFDPERDTPKALGEIAGSRHIDTARWKLAHADDATVRRIAAALEIQYRRLPSGDFSHANVISVLGTDGQIVARSTELGHADEALLSALSKP